MAETIKFMPKDLGDTITVGKLTEYLADQITSIRNSRQDYKELISSIKKLEKFSNTWQEKKDVTSALAVYEQVKKVSLQIRELLHTVLPAVEVYEKIDYALYYNGKRYVARELKPEWLRVNSKGALLINLNHATKDIEKTYNDDLVNRIRILFNNHYQLYLNMIQGTYGWNSGSKIELGKRGARVNLGHVAEAYEEHLADDHSGDNANKVYQILMIDKQEELSSSLLNAASAFEKHQVVLHQWIDHESIDAGWNHIRHSLGTQKGVVAGDVGSMQVKQTSGKDGNELRLAHQSTLKKGVALYSKILDSSQPAYIVAYQLAKYLTEPVSQESAELLTNKVSGTIDEELLRELKDKKLEMYVHI